VPVFVPIQIKKASAKISQMLVFLVPRDRIELPTRGFSDQILENSKIV